MTIQTYLTNICQHSGIDADHLEIEMTEDDQAVTAAITVPQEDSGLLIGFHGETLSAIQRLTRVVFQDELAERRLIININNYREQRAEKLQQIATRAAERVLETGRPYTFSYLPANERFVIHSTISEDSAFSELESVSEGEGSRRVLTIRLKAA